MNIAFASGLLEKALGIDFGADQVIPASCQSVFSFSFKASAKDFTESKYLPRGEFFIDSLHAQLKHYPHEFHDFFVDNSGTNNHMP